MKFYIYSLLLIFLSCNSFAQQPAYFQFGEKEFEGIDIYSLIQDDQYNYWIATEQGIIKHDGYSFKSIECDQMKSSSIFNFVKDQLGNIYCNNLNHQIFKISNGKCELFFEIPEKGKGADIYLLTTLKNELVIVSKEVYVFKSTNEKIITSEKLKHSYIGFPFLLQNGSVLFSQSGMKKVLLYKNGTFSKIPLTINDNSAPFDATDALSFMKVGRKSFGINIFKNQFYNLNEIELSVKKNLNSKLEKSSEHFRYYPINNQIWMASNISGLKLLDKQLNCISGKDNYYSDYYISHVYKDLEGNILLSTFDKGILVIPSLKSNDVIKKLKEYNLTRIISTKNQNFIGTNKGQIIEYNNDKIKILSEHGNKSLDVLYKWPNKSYLLSDVSGITILNLKTNVKTVFSSFSFKCATLRDNNSLYIGTNLGVGVLRLKESNGEFEFKVDSNLSGRTFAIQSDPLSTHVYIATTDGLKLQQKNKVYIFKIGRKPVFVSSMTAYKNKVFIYSKKHGILIFSKGKLLNKIDTKYKGENLKFLKFQFKRNRIYANTVGGFFILDLKGNVLFKLNKSNGLVSNKIVDFSVSDKIIWINHLKGLQCFELKKIQIKPKPAKIIATKIQKENKISFTLQVPTLKNRENIFYHYKLLPLDKKWNLNQYNDNQIVYNALTPGDYEFIVRSENNGVFSKPKTYSFVVQAPFYQKWWFTSLVSIFVILLVISFYRSKLKKQELESQKMNELNASKLTAIQSQMNPHFIFNSLNSIQDLVLKGDINNSYTFITKFSNLIRRTLNYSDKDFIDFDQEIKLLELYLSLEKLRFKDEVEFNLNASGIDDIQVPPMLIQPFIENALIHGLLHKEGLKKIDILFKLDKQLICEITDNGVGRVKSAEIKNRQRSDHESFAIGAIKKRFEILEKYFNGALGFEYIDLMDGETVLGTKVILRIPIKHKF